MIQRISGPLRQLWWLLALLLVGAFVCGYFVAPIVGVAMGLIVVLAPIYFAFVRYDEHGRPRD